MLIIFKTLNLKVEWHIELLIQVNRIIILSKTLRLRKSHALHQISLSLRLFLGKLDFTQSQSRVLGKQFTYEDLNCC